MGFLGCSFEQHFSRDIAKLRRFRKPCYNGYVCGSGVGTSPAALTCSCPGLPETSQFIPLEQPEHVVTRIMSLTLSNTSSERGTLLLQPLVALFPLLPRRSLILTGILPVYNVSMAFLISTNSVRILSAQNIHFAPCSSFYFFPREIFSSMPTDSQKWRCQMLRTRHRTRFSPL